MDPVLLKTLQGRALVVRRYIVGMLRNASAGSLFSSFSAVELLVWLYGAVLRTGPGGADEDNRDRFVLSRVSAAPALYAVLAERGFFGRDELWSYARLGSLLQAAPECPRTPGVDVSCGAPGMGAGIALGLALSLKDDQLAAHVFCLLGAEELGMGATWEALAAVRAPENLTLIVECPETPSCGRGTPGGAIGPRIGSPPWAAASPMRMGTIMRPSRRPDRPFPVWRIVRMGGSGLYWRGRFSAGASRPFGSVPWTRRAFWTARSRSS